MIAAMFSSGYSGGYVPLEREFFIKDDTEEFAGRLNWNGRAMTFDRESFFLGLGFAGLFDKYQLERFVLVDTYSFSPAV